MTQKIKMLDTNFYNYFQHAPEDKNYKGRKLKVMNIK